MKKTDALKECPDVFKTQVGSLERLGLYLLTSINTGWRNKEKESKPIPVMLTHFYKHGLKFKVLIKNQTLSHDGMYHVRYERFNRYTITPLNHEDLPLYAGDANENMSNAFKRAKAFTQKTV